MSGLRGDELVEALVPLAGNLVTAVHAMNAAVVSDILNHAAALADNDHLTGAHHLAILCAAMASEDHAAPAALGWTRDPQRYQHLRKTTDALTASLRAGITPADTSTTEGASA